MNHIEIPIWNKCNNRCLMCTNIESMMEKSAFTYDSVIAFLERELKRNNCTVPESVSLTGGETTICPYFFQIMNYLYQRFPEVTTRVLTNGRMFVYNNFREKCLAFKKVDFIIPLHGYSPKSHDQVTQVSGSFSQTIEGLKKLFRDRKEGQKIELRIVVTRLNLEITPRIFKFIGDNFPSVDRVVLIFLEFEGKAEVSKDRVGITYLQIQPVLEKIRKYFKIFKDLRLYHFPLCVLDPSFWPYAWRTLPAEEVTYLSECQKCLLKKYCLGVHKSYFKFNKSPEINPRRSLEGIKIKGTGNFYHPIDSIEIEKVVSDLEALTRLTQYLMSRKTEPTKYFFTSLLFRLNKPAPFTAFRVKQWWEKAVEEKKEKRRQNLLNFYVHIPFCKSRGNFCRCFSIVLRDKDMTERYIKSISDEIHFYKDVFSGREFHNIYIGGGSPSILSENQTEKLLAVIFDNFKFFKYGEGTFECHPRNITLEKMKILKRFGINRISCGVQSLDPKVLRHINRDYQTYESVKSVIQNAKSCGMTVNTDLMIGFANDSPESVKESFLKIIKLQPTNISLYPFKPLDSYLRKYFRNNERDFYLQLKNKIEQTLKLLMPIANKFNYTYPDAIYLSDGYCGNFFKKEKIKRKSDYYDREQTYSDFGIGPFSVSKIVGIGRYINMRPIDDSFIPSKACYQAIPCQLKEDMSLLLVSSN